jgi:L-histidine N-alpha-methyltransferase
MAAAKTLVPTDYAARETPLGAEVFAGLSARPKTLSPWLFYDTRGSQLFEQITALPEYYVTRTERGILAAHAAAIVKEAAGGQRLAMIELGAGTASKTGLLLSAAAAQQGSVDYYAIDVSESALTEAKRHLELELPGVLVHPRVGDYTEGLGRIDAPGERKLVLYIGSSIGNFEPADATALLASVRAELSPGDQLLLGADQVKNPSVLLAAYDDAAGVTAAFNRNLLDRINRELGANFDPDAFAHEARWNPARSRIEMHLRSERSQSVDIPDLALSLHFAAGETIHTENSYKFTDERIFAMLEQAGFALEQEWKDKQNWFAVYLARAC